MIGGRLFPRGIGAALLAALLLSCGAGEAPPSRGDARPRGEEAAPSGASPAPGELSPGAQGPDPSPLDTPTASDPAAAPAPWTVGVVDVPSSVGPTGGLPVVTAVRTGLHAEYERLTVELETAPGDPGFPGYHLEYVDRPLHQCGSGAEIHPVGDAWLELRLEPAQAHTEAGRPTLAGRELPASGGLGQRIYMTCDFEGVVTLVLALASPNPFRAFTLREPPRLVLDVRR